MSTLFAVGVEGTNLVPYVPEYLGNHKAPEDRRIVCWYEPYSLGESKRLQDDARKVKASKSEEEGLKLLDDALARVRLLTRGKPGDGVSSDVQADIVDTLGQHRGLVEDVALAIVASQVSEVDAAFFGWLSTGVAAA